MHSEYEPLTNLLGRQNLTFRQDNNMVFKEDNKIFEEDKLFSKWNYSLLHTF
jgi:hypothetical protein